MSTAHNEDYRILIRSVSEQFEHTEPLPAEETDKIELMTYGSFLKKAGSYYISYKETETIGFAGCTTTIKIAEDGSVVKLTIAHYYTPLGNDIHKVGITPDVEVELPDDATSDVQLEKALEVVKGLESAE